jgi:peptidoglycan/xylan/chitin deacetylase (PgdA/CDA1 family)
MSFYSPLKDIALAACRYSGINRRQRLRLRRQLLVLGYHGVVSRRQRDRLRYASTVNAAEFESHVRELRRHFHPISLADLRNWYEGADDLPDNPVLVTFDDGYRNNLTLAAPILQAYKIPCIFHISTGYIGTPRVLWTTELYNRFMAWPWTFVPTPEGGKAPVPKGGRERGLLAFELKEQCKKLSWEQLQSYLERLREAPAKVEEDEELERFMSWDEVRELRRQGFEIGSHTVEHPILSRVSPEQLHFELRESRRRLEQETGARCTTIAYPNGSISQEVVDAAFQEGYRMGFTVIEKFTARPVNALAVNRVTVMGHLPVNDFLCRVSGVLTPSDGGAGQFAAPEAARAAAH